MLSAVLTYSKVMIPLFWLSCECCSCMSKWFVLVVIPSVRTRFSADWLSAYIVIAVLSGLVGSISNRSCRIYSASAKAVYSASLVDTRENKVRLAVL